MANLVSSKGKLMLKLPTLFILFATFFHIVPAAVTTAKFYSFVSPHIPTTDDSISVLLKGYITEGITIDSSFTISGNDILITYTVVDSLQTIFNTTVDKVKKIGNLPSGAYRIISTTVYKHTRGPRAGNSSMKYDTLCFEVLASVVKPPRIVGQLYVDDYNISDPNSVKSYSYWNGDTLSVATAFQWGDSKISAQLTMQSDTIAVTFVDTSFLQLALVRDYLCIVSICPVTPGKNMVKISKRSLVTEYNNPRLHSLVTNYRGEGLGLSVKKPGASEFILCMDSVLQYYIIYSPFLDTLKTFCLQPNPHFIAHETHNLFIGYPRYELVSRLNFWDDSTYQSNDWSYTNVQASDQLFYDTMALNGGYIFNLNYSNSVDDTVLSYISRDVYPVLSSTNPAPWIGFYASFKNPAISINNPEKKANNSQKETSAGIQIIQSKQGLQIFFRSPTNFTGNSKCLTTIMITDIQGRLIKRFESLLSVDGNSFFITWDKYGQHGTQLVKGAYLISMLTGNKKHSAKMVHY